MLGMGPVQLQVGDICSSLWVLYFLGGKIWVVWGFLNYTLVVVMGW